MELIADTNVFLAVILNEPSKERIVKLTTGATLIAPEILPYEIGKALSAMVKRRRITVEEALAAENEASVIPVRLINVDVHAALQLALDQNIYAYDTYFLHCAKTFSQPLLTLDRRMKEVANELAIHILE